MTRDLTFSNISVPRPEGIVALHGVDLRRKWRWELSQMSAKRSAVHGPGRALCRPMTIEQSGHRLQIVAAPASQVARCLEGVRGTVATQGVRLIMRAARSPKLAQSLFERLTQ